MATEIEKLENRWRENKQGLTFAPLAEAYRKSGDLHRALEVLKPGLELHPDYIPASIVLGRCHLDLGDDSAAEVAFTHVLALDPENVIALKALADVAERQLRLEEAERWLHMLVAVDRSNDEARQQLERVEAARRQPAGAAAPAVAEAMDDGEESLAGVLDAEPEAATAEAEPEDEEPAPDLIETVESSTSAWLASPPAEPLTVERVAGFQSGAFAAPDELPDTPVAGFEPDKPIAAPDSQPLTAGASEDIGIEQHEDIVLRPSASYEYQIPSASEEFHGLTPAASNEFQVPSASDDFFRVPEPAAEPILEPEPEPVAEEPAEPDLVVTETMAELYVRQGHYTEALQVYRELASRRPDDPRLATRVAELSVMEERDPADAGGGSRYRAAETGGESVGAMLQHMLGSRPGDLDRPTWREPAATEPPPEPPAPPAQPPQSHAESPPPSGAPTRPAPDHLSLSAVFGDDVSPTPPAIRREGANGGVSFDEFFGGPAASDADGAPRRRSVRGPSGEDDDLDQFHTWLQNLKR